MFLKKVKIECAQEAERSAYTNQLNLKFYQALDSFMYFIMEEKPTNLVRDSSIYFRRFKMSKEEIQDYTAKLWRYTISLRRYLGLAGIPSSVPENDEPAEEEMDETTTTEEEEKSSL